MTEFQKVSQANIAICAGANDGILIWISMPTLKQADNTEVGQMKFLCGHKESYPTFVD